MAGNMKGQGGVKGLLLQHGEKAVIALVGLVALWLIYKTMSLPRLEDKYRAAKLHSEITETSSAVQNAQWPEPGSDQSSEVRIAPPVEEKADVPISSKAYALDTKGFNPRVIAPTVLRTDPQLLNAVEVRANGGSGLFAFTDEKIRHALELKLAAEQAELAKKQADEAAKQQKQTTEGGPGFNSRRGRGPGIGPEAGIQEVYDPKHPKRRQVLGMSQPHGVQLQGGERIEQAYWAIVVAKVPIREQLKLYQDAFEKAKGGFDPARDFPQYKGYFVQRVEVVPGQEIKEADWKPVPVYDGQRTSIAANEPLSPGMPGAMGVKTMQKLYERAQQFWAGMLPDVIDSRFSDYVLTFPLPPLVGRDWGAEATHPGIPLLADTPPLEQEVAPPITTPENAPANSGSPFSAGPTGTVPGAGYSPGSFGPGAGPGRFGGLGRMGFGPGRMGEMGPGGMPSYGRGLEGGYGYGGPEGGGRMTYAGPGLGATGQRTSLVKGVDFLLLRFFDFTVEPGKKYKYRVRLVLADPNYNIPDNVLAPAVLDRVHKAVQATQKRPEFRAIEIWSDPSPTVGIPLSGDVKLVDVKVPSADKVNDEPSAKLLVSSFDVDERDKNNAIQAAIERDFRRGFVANFQEDAEYLVEGGTAIDTRENFKFMTGMTLLDVDGGQKLTKDMTTPGRVLIMGPAGELYIHDEIDDKPVVEYHKVLFQKPDKRRGMGPEGPGFGPARPQRFPRGR